MAEEEKKRKIETNQERAERIMHDPNFWDDYKDDDEYETKWSPKFEEWVKKFIEDEDAEYEEEEESDKGEKEE